MLTLWSRNRARLVLVVMLTLGPLPALQAEGIGWRTDGTGVYSKAQPPLEWSPSKNVVWKTPMPGYGVSHPVPLGNRVFICSEPCILLCLDRKDGEIIWQKSCSYSDLAIDQETREKLAAELEKMAELKKKQSVVEKEKNQLVRDIRKEEGTKKEIEQKIREKTKPFDARINELKKEQQKLTIAVRYTQPGTHGYAGYSAPTPVTNGKDVWVAFGNGLVACYDLNGKRKWLKLIEHSNAAFAHSGSPVLAGGKLLIHFTDLVALDPKTGEESWRFKHPWSHGTPLVTKIGDTEVVLTPRGAILRAKDGKLLADKLGSSGANSPILHKGIVYYVRGEATAFRLPESVENIDKPLKMKPLWKGKATGGGYWFSSPVIHDGLLYAASDQGVLSVLDASTGEKVYEETLNLRGSTYPSISLAGNRVYISSDNGSTVVIEPGKTYKELARSKLNEAFRSSLVFDGKRVYARTGKNLYCIGE